MDIRAQNRPRPTQAPESRSSTMTPGPVHQSGQPGTKWIIILIVSVLVFALLVVGGVFFFKKMMSTEKAVKTDGYQALFLTNNQVYFGHLKNVDDHYLLVTDVYYLQVQQQGVQASDKDKTNVDTQQASLSKLGTEVHGPEDAMYIAHDQVLFWENLKDDGKVVQAIKDYQKNNK